MEALNVLGAAPQIRGIADVGFNSLSLKFGPPEFLWAILWRFARGRCHKVPARGCYYDCYIVSGHNGDTLYEK